MDNFKSQWINRQRPRSVNKRQRGHFHVLRTTQTRREIQSIIKIDFNININNKIVLAVLERF